MTEEDKNYQTLLARIAHEIMNNAAEFDYSKDVFIAKFHNLELTYRNSYYRYSLNGIEIGEDAGMTLNAFIDKVIKERTKTTIKNIVEGWEKDPT